MQRVRSVSGRSGRPDGPSPRDREQDDIYSKIAVAATSLVLGGFGLVHGSTNTFLMDGGTVAPTDLASPVIPFVAPGVLERAAEGYRRALAHQRQVRYLRSCGTSSCNRRMLIWLTWRTWRSHQEVECQLEIENREDPEFSLTATNPLSGDFGMGQLAVTNVRDGHRWWHAGWGSSALSQVHAMIGYEKGRYGDPCGGEAHELADGWY